MSGDCLDIGTIQAFLDGELTPERDATVSGHIASCDACSMMLGEAEEESAFVFPVLERELNTLVPTQRLSARIKDSIAVEKQNTPFWKKILTGIAVTLRNPSITVAAGVLIMFGVFAVFYTSFVDKPVDRPVPQVARVTQPQPVASDSPISNVDNGPESVTPPVREQNPVKVQPAFSYERADYRQPVRPVRETKGPDAVNQDGYLPGEESYVKTIATLSDSVNNQKDTVLKP